MCSNRTSKQRCMTRTTVKTGLGFLGLLTRPFDGDEGGRCLCFHDSIKGVAHTQGTRMFGKFFTA